METEQFIKSVVDSGLVNYLHNELSFEDAHHNNGWNVGENEINQEFSIIIVSLLISLSVHLMASAERMAQNWFYIYTECT